MIRLKGAALGLALTAITASHAIAAAPSAPTVLNATDAAIASEATNATNVSNAPMVTDPALGPATESIVSGAIEKPASPTAAALRARLNGLPTEGTAQEIKERAVLSDFYRPAATRRCG